MPRTKKRSTRSGVPPHPPTGGRPDLREDEPVIPSTIPHGRTARRLEWAHLPPHIRADQARSLARALRKGDPESRGVITQAFKEKILEFLPGR